MGDRSARKDCDPARASHTGTSPWALIVLTGGRSTRMGSRKDILELDDGVPVVVRLLRAVPSDVPVVVVGPEPPTGARAAAAAAQPAAPVVVTREEPPGGGPLAGIAAGLRLVDTPVVAVAAGDMPFAGPLLGRLARRYCGWPGTTSGTASPAQGAPDQGGGWGRRDHPGHGTGRGAADGTPEPEPAEPTRPEALVPVDADGHPQPLCAVYDTAALRRGVAALNPPAGRSMRQLLNTLRFATTAVDDDRALFDVDTPADLASARGHLLHRPGDPAIMATSRSAGGAMKQWIDAVKQELGLDIDVDVTQILDVAKDAAHSVQRPAAPVTTYLLGYAIASGADPGEAAGIVRRLANTWSAPE